jgi:Tol biopolymer transport system component/predicted Ser/Thr protein kinase
MGAKRGDRELAAGAQGASVTLSAGTRLGPYEVVAPLGAGGMGEVWRGRDTRLDRSVAIKILPADFAENAQFKLRFEREAKTISQLNHPNICTLYDVGDSYLVMELLEGESLAERLAKGPLPLEQVLRYGVQIAEALDKAHRAGIVHRDLKPGNVMLTKSGAKLLDFGLAKSARIFDADGATQHKALTQEGMILGTFQYMAPEQLEGIEADARTDIFAFGTLLYEMATGKRAFEGKTKTSLIAAIVSAEPAPMSQIVPLTPPALEHVVRKCLAKDRDDRWQSAHDIAEELKWISEAGSQAGVAAPLLARKKSRERMVWMAAIVALAGAWIASRALQRPQPPPAQYRFTIPMIDSGYRFGTGAQMSPDGRTIYFAASTAATPSHRLIFRRRLDELAAVPIEGTERVGGSFRLTPDGGSLIVPMAGGVIKRISVDGGPPQPVADGVTGGNTAMTISPDGTILIGSNDFPIRRILPGGKVDEVTQLDKAHGENGHDWPWFLPDGKQYLFLSVMRDAAHGTIHRTLCATSIGSKDIKRIDELPTRFEYALGRIFFVREATLMARPFDIARLQFTGEAVPVIGNIPFDSRTGSASFSVSPSGVIACSQTASVSHLTWVDASGKKLATIGKPFSIGTISAVPSRAFVVPGAQQVVLSIVDHRTGTASVWIQGLTRDTSSRLTFSAAFEASPVVTPDGSRVFFGGDAQSTIDIFEAPLDGSTPPKLVVSAPNLQVPNDISRDGRFLLYTSNQTQTATKQDLWVLPLTGERKPYPFLATPAGEGHGVFSPDGKWIAYTSDATGTGQVYIRPFPGPGAARPVSTQGGGTPRFSPDGRKIYFLETTKLMTADFHADGSVSEPKAAFELDDRVATYEPIGDRFLMVLRNDIDTPPVRIIANWQPPHS